MARTILVILICTPCCLATNFFASDSDVALLLRFESTASLGINSAHSADGAVTGVVINNAVENEGVGCGKWAADFGGDITITHANQPAKLLDGSDFTICGWFKLDAVGARTLYSQGTEGSNLSLKLEVHDAGATESFQVVLGYGDGSSSDTYTHASDLDASSWHWVGVTVDTDGDVIIRVYRDGIGALGTDIDTACLHAYTANSESVIIGDYYNGYMDELVVFDRALSSAELDTVRAGTFNTSAGPFSYYCSTTGNNARLGTSALPWGELSTLQGDRKFGVYFNEGDTIFLETGNHGYLDLEDAETWEKIFTDWVYIKAVPGSAPVMSGAHWKSAVYWKFDGTDAASGYIDVTPDSIAQHVPDSPYTLFYNSNYSDAQYMWFEGLFFYPIADTDAWDGDDWAWYSYRGILAGQAADITVTGCKFYSCCQAVGGTRDRATITHNTIERWTENGIFVGEGDNITITDNTILDCMYYSHSADIWEDTGACWHADHIQIGNEGTSEDLVVSRNYCNFAVNPARELKGTPQGLFLVCGLINAKVCNNVVMSFNAAHGISVGYGDPINSPIDGLLIYGNTIIPPDGCGETGSLAIKFQGEETDTRNNIRVIGNLGGDIWEDSNTDTWIWQDNIDTDDITADDEFTDYSAGDMTLKVGSALIDQITHADGDAPATDIDGNSRDATPDVGAYEYGGEAPPASTTHRVLINRY